MGRRGEGITPILAVVVFPLLAVMLSACGVGTETPGGGGDDGGVSRDEDDGRESVYELVFEPLSSEGLDAWREKSGIDGGDYFSHLVQDGTTLAFFLGGSSSCPPEVDSGSIDDNGNVMITLAPGGVRACTTDYVPYGWVGTIPDDVSDVRVREAIVRSDAHPAGSDLAIVNLKRSSPFPSGEAQPSPSDVPGTPEPTSTGVPVPRPWPSMTIDPRPDPPVYSLRGDTDLN